MKRYWLFAGDFFYPIGGLLDFQGDFDDWQDAVESAQDKDWFHILDTKTNKVLDVKRPDSQEYKYRYNCGDDRFKNFNDS